MNRLSVFFLVTSILFMSDRLRADDEEHSSKEFFNKAKKQDPFCYVSGSVRSVNKDKPDTEPRSEMIRLRFEATDTPSCIRSIQAHCVQAWRPAGFYPFQIKIKYRKLDVANSEQAYKVNTDCTLEQNPELDALKKEPTQ